MPYAEIEVMKMILQLKTNISGTVTLKVCRVVESSENTCYIL